MQAYLKTTALYANLFEEVWLWTEFPFHDQFGGKDTGIDLGGSYRRWSVLGHPMQMLCGGYVYR